MNRTWSCEDGVVLLEITQFSDGFEIVDYDMVSIHDEHVFLGELIEHAIDGFPGCADRIGDLLMGHRKINRNFASAHGPKLFSQPDQEGQHALSDALTGE